MSELTNEELRGLQQKGLSIARYLVSFCNENGLLLYFCGGCCIGALRHKGFVPWDDDVDFFMPREDYERLCVLWAQKADTERYTLVRSNERQIDHSLLLTIKDNATTCIKTYQQDLDICHGVAVDVLPLDGYPDSAFSRKVQLFWALLYSLYCAQLVPENHGAAFRFLGKAALWLVPSTAMRYRIWHLAQNKMSRWRIANCSAVTELCSGPHYMKNRYPKEWFASAVWKEFEGVQMPLPVGYDAYLRLVFGDYLSLPPKEKQAPCHDAVFTNLEHSYRTYKGKYYCVKK